MFFQFLETFINIFFVWRQVLFEVFGLDFFQDFLAGVAFHAPDNCKSKILISTNRDKTSFFYLQKEQKLQKCTSSWWRHLFSFTLILKIRSLVLFIVNAQRLSSKRLPVLMHKGYQSLNTKTCLDYITFMFKDYHLLYRTQYFKVEWKNKQNKHLIII